MDGLNVFTFALGVVPKSIREIRIFADRDLMDIDHIVLHQANKFMTDFFIKRLKYPIERVPYLSLIHIFSRLCEKSRSCTGTGHHGMYCL